MTPVRSLALACLLLGGAPATSSAQELELDLDPGAAFDAAIRVRNEELSKTAYQFCHDTAFEPASAYGERRFCKVWDARAAEACPEARSICEPDEVGWLEKLLGGLSLPSWLGWLLLAAGITVVLALIVRVFLEQGWRSTPDVDLGSVVTDAMAGQLQALPEAPTKAILRKAREVLAAGQADEAAILVQLACLRWFDDSGWVTFHPSKTNGEYLRAVRHSEAHHGLYRRVARETDRVRFGGSSADPAVVEALIADAERHLGDARALPGLHAAPALMCLALAGSLAQSGCADNRKPYYSRRPAGYAALPALLDGIGLDVRIDRMRVDEIPPDVGVVVLASSIPSDIPALAFDDLLDRDVRIVIIDDAGEASHFLPITTSSASVMPLAGMGQVLQLGAESPPAEDVFVHDTLFCGADLRWIDARLGPARVRLPRAAGLVERAETGTVTVSGRPIAVDPLLLADDGPGRMSARAYGGIRLDGEGLPLTGCLLVFSSGDLFSNASLVLPQNAQLVAALFASITPRHKAVLLLDGLSPAKSSIGRSMADARLMPFIVHGLLWVALLFVMLGAAFGPLRDQVRIEHKAFVEHVEALGRQYARLGEPGLAHMARSLARYAVMRHRADARGGWAPLAHHLAEKYGLPEDDVRIALRLGSEGAADLGPAVPEGVAQSEGVLRALSVLITGRARQPRKPARYRR